MRTVRDHYLPPDREAFLAAEPPTGRVIVIAPTRAACETIELAMGLHIDTLIEREHGAEIRELAAAGKGFGIVAGTGTGKTLAVRPMAEAITRSQELRVGVVNREREATPDTPSWNVVIVTTGIARRWFQAGDILERDTLVVDEIHQTSAELELCLALGKRAGCRFIWLSATVDPTFYREYLGSSSVIESYAFDPSRAATVKVTPQSPADFLEDRFLRDVQRERRGVGVFLPTRAAVEQVASMVRHRNRRIHSAFYHGGEPIRAIRPFLEGEVKKPYLLAMTAAGQSALNVQGLDTVVIDDTRFANVVEHGRNVLTKLHLGANEILQMAGRVHGRVENGRVFILSDRDIEFRSLKPTAPEFQLAGDSERVALTCAAIGVRADELDLPVPLDRRSYQEAMKRLESRGVVDENGRLSAYGQAVEAMPVDRAWAELLVHADDELVPFIAVAASVDSLYRMTREDPNLRGLVVPGSDHLTAYNLYAEAFERAGVMGQVYGLPRHTFDERVQDWAEDRGALVKSVEDAALGMASIYRTLEMPLPSRMPLATERTLQKYAELLARIMPFELVIDERTATGHEVRVSKGSVCGRSGAIAGVVRYFADKFGNPRGSIEGTQIPLQLIRRFAARAAPEIRYEPERKRTPLTLVRAVEYFGFELYREYEGLEVFPDDLAPRVRRALAEAMARGEARHPAVQRNRTRVEEVREMWRRSGGTTPRLSQAELIALYEERLLDARSMDDFLAADLALDLEGLVDEEQRQRLARLPDEVSIRDKRVPIQYDVEDGAAVARLRLPAKLARTLDATEVPQLDRPVRFIVTRGQRGAVRAETLDELQEILARPWSPEEPEEDARERADRSRRGKQSARSRGNRHRGRGGPGRGRRRRG